MLATVILAQNKQHRGKRRRKEEGEVRESHANCSSKMNSTAGAAFKFVLA